MLQNAYFLAKIGADTAENEQHFADILPIGRRVADRDGRLDLNLLDQSLTEVVGMLSNTCETYE